MFAIKQLRLRFDTLLLRFDCSSISNDSECFLFYSTNYFAIAEEYSLFFLKIVRVLVSLPLECLYSIFALQQWTIEAELAINVDRSPKKTEFFYGCTALKTHQMIKHFAFVPMLESSH